MAQFVAKILAASEDKKASVRKDKAGRPMANVQDIDTGQFLTVWAKKGSDVDLSALKPGDLVEFMGTVHPLFDNVKMYAQRVTVIKPKK